MALMIVSADGEGCAHPVLEQRFDVAGERPE